MMQNNSTHNNNNINQELNKNIRVRFAPSPTGLLHVGSFRTALFNWLFARKHNGTFILRIEDTDRKRSKDEFLKSQLSDMEWMGLDWDEGPQKGGESGPYFQMERLETYREYSNRLLEEGKAYKCYCTPEELKEERKRQEKLDKNTGYGGKCRNLSPEQVENFEKEGRQPCIRFKVPDSGYTKFNDYIKGEMSFDNSLMDDFVIMKSDSIPTYNFAVVIDDCLMKITHVIRGDEHLSNTPKQVVIYQALAASTPLFVHIPIILNEDRTKLSKRKGAVHLLEYRDKGYLKEALLNFLVLLGWAPGNDREIFSLKELTGEFSLDGITKHPAVFDEKKLVWMNGQYISSIDLESLIPRIKVFLKKLNVDPDIYDPDWYKKSVTLYRTRMKTLVDFAENLLCFFTDLEEYDESGVKKRFKFEFLIDALPQLADRIKADNDFSVESLEKIVRDYAEELGVSAGKLIHAVRLSITGMTNSPPIFDVMLLAGKELLYKRLNKAAEFISERFKSEGKLPR